MTLGIGARLQLAFKGVLLKALLSHLLTLLRIKLGLLGPALLLDIGFSLVPVLYAADLQWNSGTALMQSTFP